MVTELSRRALLGAAAVLAAPHAFAARTAPRFAAAWDGGNGHAIGLLAATPEALSVIAHAEVPTRAHGLAAARDGSLIAVARRPGDWLLRWHPVRGTQHWVWAEPGRAFNGHAAFTADGGRLFTTETDTDSGAGLVGVRDGRSLAKLAEWPAHGLDPHELLAEGSALWVANGGIPTWAETGRSKRELHRMDSSLVRLHPATGRLAGQWRVADARLSLRHLARNRGQIGIAMQAEHDDLAAREAAPLLALFDGQALRCAPPPPGPSQRGYGGDIAALGDGFIVSATRANCAGPWAGEAGWQAPVALDSAGALAEAAGQVWIAGADRCSVLSGDRRRVLALPQGVRIDNHWIGWTAA
jgi:hypothetical protein